MRNDRLKKATGIFFISIFFVKMMITAVPLIWSMIDDGTVGAVILQLEIEEKEKADDKLKESFNKGQYLELLSVSFDLPVIEVSVRYPSDQCRQHIQSFYPAVPTPPPDNRV